jgi:hypothetical protein
MIVDSFKLFLTKLDESELMYSDFKYALMPSNKKCDHIFVFDTAKIKESFYGCYVFDYIIPYLDKDSTHNVLWGDLLDFSNGKNVSAILDVMFAELKVKKIDERQYTNRFFMIYINNIRKNEIEKINESLKNEDFFVGECDMTYASMFKSYISQSMGTCFVKIGERIIMGHEDDIEDNSNMNMAGLPFEKSGYSITSIQGSYFDLFLKYKVDSDFVPELNTSDNEIVSNLISKNLNDITSLDMSIPSKKIRYVEDTKKVLTRMEISSSDFTALIKRKINTSVIYNMTFDKTHDVVKFTIFIDRPTNDILHKYECGLVYDYKNEELRLTTMY